MPSSFLKVLVVLAMVVPAALAVGGHHLGRGHHRVGRRHRGGGHRPRLTYHGGAMLTGNVDIAIMWYGQVTKPQKDRVLAFLKSLNGIPGPVPTVAGWWKMVESYQGMLRRPAGPIRVNVVSEVDDPNASLGKVLVKDFIAKLLPVATKGRPNTLAVIVAARGITVIEMCAGKCAQHGTIAINGKPQPFVAVGEPESECPECIWPLARDIHKPTAPLLKPPSGDLGADATVMLLAGGLVEAVINPFGDGFFGTRRGDDVENSVVCKGIYGSGWNRGSPGKFLVDRITGGAFNAHGIGNTKFFLPAVFDPRLGKCWTPI